MNKTSRTHMYSKTIDRAAQNESKHRAALSLKNSFNQQSPLKFRDGKCYSVNTTAVNTATDGQQSLSSSRRFDSTTNRYMVIETIGSTQQQAKQKAHDLVFGPLLSGRMQKKHSHITSAVQP